MADEEQVEEQVEEQDTENTVEITKTKKELPTPIAGIEYYRLPEDRVCQNCARLVLATQPVVRRTALGYKKFADILPAKNGICLNCAADGLSEMSVTWYEKLLKQLQVYDALKDKNELGESEVARMKGLEVWIGNLQLFIEELGSFVKYTDDSGVQYYDDHVAPQVIDDDETAPAKAKKAPAQAPEDEDDFFYSFD